MINKMDAYTIKWSHLFYNQVYVDDRKYLNQDAITRDIRLILNKVILEIMGRLKDGMIEQSVITDYVEAYYYDITIVLLIVNYRHVKVLLKDCIIKYLKQNSIHVIES